MGQLQLIFLAEALEALLPEEKFARLRVEISLWRGRKSCTKCELAVADWEASAHRPGKTRASELSAVVKTGCD